MTSGPSPSTRSAATDGGHTGLAAGADPASAHDSDAADSADPAERVVLRNHTVETVFCALILALGLLVVFDSYKAGAGWADDGPQSGYFPFYIGLLLCLASVAQIASVLRGRAGSHAGGATPFLTKDALGRIAGLMLPLLVYVALIGPLGIYLASFLFIGYFMQRYGEQGPVATVLTAAGFTLVAFLMFERWFKVPLPKGPVEAWLGLV